MKIENLITIATSGNECQMFEDDGMFINWTEKKPLNELPSLIAKANETARENGLKTIVNVPSLENTQEVALSFAMDKFDFQYLLGDQDLIPLEDRIPKFQEKIALLKAGLFE